MGARRYQVRLGAGFVQPLADAGSAAADESTLLRALILLGLASAGIDIAGLARDAAQLAYAPLAPAVRSRLLDLYSDRSTAGVQPEYNRPSAVELPIGDPFAGIGMEV